MRLANISCRLETRSLVPVEVFTQTDSIRSAFPFSSLSWLTTQRPGRRENETGNCIGHDTDTNTKPHLSNRLWPFQVSGLRVFFHPAWFLLSNSAIAETVELDELAVGVIAVCLTPSTIVYDALFLPSETPVVPLPVAFPVAFPVARVSGFS